MVRRSATICLFSPTDKDMLNAKTGNWFVNNPQRARSNNSVMLLRNKTSRELFSNIMESVKEFGEPGFVWTEDEDILFNPCVEIGMYPQTQGGKSGWQGCNLTEINGAACVTEDKFYELCEASAILGTLQAGYTNFKYVPKVSKEIFDREALLGCSVTGWCNNPEVLFNPEIQRKGAEIILKTNERVANLLGINKAARATCCKPSGNASVILMTESGIHGGHSKRYFRNAQLNKDSDVAKHLVKVNPEAAEDSVWSENNTDYVFSFPIIAKEDTLFKKDLLGTKQLELVKLTQQNWVESGTREPLCVNSKTRHNVSNTIQVDNWDDVEEYIYDNRKYLAGVSLLSNSGDKDYAQAPFVEILDSEELLDKYHDAALFASGLIVDGLKAFHDDLWLACSTVLGVGLELGEVDSKNCLQHDWVRRVHKFSKKYFDEDVKLTTYCLKDVYNYHRWLNITKNMKSIDWENVDLEETFTDVGDTGAKACAGGACDVSF